MCGRSEAAPFPAAKEPFPQVPELEREMLTRLVTIRLLLFAAQIPSSGPQCDGIDLPRATSRLGAVT